MSDLARVSASLAAALLGLIGLLGQAAAEPTLRNARVVWVRDDHVYVASPDSLVLEEGQRLSFLSRGKTIAAGVVLGVHDRALAVALITSGSLRSVKRPERLRIVAERSRVRPPPVLRVGYPSGARTTLFFACHQVELRSPLPGGVYRRDVSSERSYRLVRDPGAVGEAAWPDTLLIRLFDESADQEIALERGELDVGVFWPGELSSHMRAQPRGQGALSHPRTRGIVAAVRLGPEEAGDADANAFQDARTFASLDLELFRGDLHAERVLATWQERADPRWSTRPIGARRYEVDPACPGRSLLERVLNRARGAVGPEVGGLVRLFYLDCPVARADSLSCAAADYVRSGPFPPDVRVRADRLLAEIRHGKANLEGAAATWPLDLLADSLRVTFPFAITCPVVCDAQLLPYVGHLATMGLVDMLDCVTTGRRP